MSIEGQEKSSSEERQALLENRASNGSKSRKNQVMESLSEESVVALDQIFVAKLASLRTAEQRLANISDPYARKALAQMIEEERTQLMNLAELIEMVEQKPNSGSFTKVRRQMSHRLKSPSNKNFAYGMGIAIVGTLLYPTIKDSLHPVAMKAIQGVKALSEQAQGLISSVREDMEDLVAEAEFENLKQSIDSAVVEETMPEYHAPVE